LAGKNPTPQEAASFFGYVNRLFMLFPILGLSSSPVVVAQLDEGHA